jgi:uncharacterized protein (DUF1499 family)
MTGVRKSLSREAEICDGWGMDFSTLRFKESPNHYLVCPDGLVTDAQPHAASPEFPLSADALRRLWRDVALRQPRVAMVRDDPDHNQCDFVQRSLIFRFPDTVTVQFIDLGGGRSTCAVYSRSKYGHGDLGVNRRRVQRWLGEVVARAAAMPALTG